ncbi:gpr1 fun34 yaah [Trichoderma arundinaceum]|uniref:Gpr1 fun34 yaah n=1 Tax=Trichoderma arundinaceum TaxID=490622 RepID=A0A395NJY3_TRIAR|nr:gpr1 fun34 yaah [Trichoderma arundinaceum]
MSIEDIDKISPASLELRRQFSETAQEAHNLHSHHNVAPTTNVKFSNPTALAIGCFATTLTTLSLTLMEWRNVTITNAFAGNFFFAAGLGMVISAQWEMALGNSFGYTVFSAFGFFYAGLGAINLPFFGVVDAYANNASEHNNALGFYVLMWAVFNIFFLVASFRINVVYIGIFLTIELGFTLVAASYFALADGDIEIAIATKKAGGAFCFVSGLLGWYTLAHLMCQESTFLTYPMGDTSRYFVHRSKKVS